jgi:HSP20 family molecular chaperone IbpA
MNGIGGCSSSSAYVNPDGDAQSCSITWTGGDIVTYPCPATNWFTYITPTLCKWFTTDNGADIEVDLPGYDPTTVKVSYGDLIVAGSRGINVKAEREGNQPTSFNTSIYINEDQYDVDSITSSFKNGVLKISLVKIKPDTRDIKVELL